MGPLGSVAPGLAHVLSLAHVPSNYPAEFSPEIHSLDGVSPVLGPPECLLRTDFPLKK